MRGFRTIRSGWMDPFYKGKPKAAPAAPMTPEQIEARRVANDALTARFLNDVAARSAGRAITKLVDREARIAVEGDTDLNHDNVEAAE